MTPHLRVKEESALLNMRSHSKFLPGSARRLAAAGLLALLCLLVLAGCQDKQSEAKATTPPPVEVGVIALHPQAVPLNTELPGRTTASLVAEVRPQVDGIIRERLFREGSEVLAGEVLYRVAPSTYQAEYSNALAALKRAQASLPSSESKAKRYAELIEQGAISKQDFQDAQAVYEADLAAVASAKAALESAKISLDYTEIKAPISGRVEMSDLTPGALVTANQSAPLTTIRQLDPINVDLTQSSTTMLNLSSSSSKTGPFIPTRGPWSFPGPRWTSPPEPTPCAPSSPTRTASCCPACTSGPSSRTACSRTATWSPSGPWAVLPRVNPRPCS
jgi:membrane fusion protein (multidrug efflux system)